MAYWVSTHMEGGALIPTGRKYPVRTKEDPDLRSAWDLLDYEVWATDGEVGRLEGLIMDEASWHLGYLGRESWRLATQPLCTDSYALGEVHFLGPVPCLFASHNGRNIG